MSPIFVILSFFLALTVAQDASLLSSYPFCSVQCQVEVFLGSSNPCGSDPGRNLTCGCSPGDRSLTAACEKVSCSPADYTKGEVLADQFCSPRYYNNGIISGASVSAAIAAATASASAAVAGKNASNLNDYPACATTCQLQIIPQSGCRSLSNTSCVCGNVSLNEALGACEQATCSSEDIGTILYLSYELCKSAGGVGNASAIATQSPNPLLPPVPTTSVVPFTGGAGSSGMWEVDGWVVVVAALGSLGLLM